MYYMYLTSYVPHFFHFILADRRTTYKLWKIGQTKGKNPLCKDLEKDIKIVVRCKIDGYEVSIIHLHSNNSYFSIHTNKIS